MREYNNSDNASCLVNRRKSRNYYNKYQLCVITVTITLPADLVVQIPHAGILQPSKTNQIASSDRFTVVSRTLEMIKKSTFHLSNVNRR